MYSNAFRRLAIHTIEQSRLRHALIKQYELVLRERGLHCNKAQLVVKMTQPWESLYGSNNSCGDEHKTIYCNENSEPLSKYVTGNYE